MGATADDTDIGHMTVLKKATGPGTYVTLAETTEITMPEFTRDAAEFTHTQSPDRYREYKPGLIDPGEVGVVYNLIPGEADDLIVAQHIESEGVDDWRIEYPNGATFDFRGFATSHQHAVPIGEAMTGAVTFKLSGKPTLTPAP